MSKGFSGFQKIVVLACLVTMYHGSEGMSGKINFGSITGQVNYAYDQKSIFSAEKYIRQVGDAISQVNG